MNIVQGETRRFLTSIWRFAQEIIAFGLLYNMIINIVNKLHLLITGAAKGMALSEVVTAEPVATPIISVVLKDPIATAIILCIVTGVLTYVVFRYICQSQWVQEKVNVKKCWEEVKWYNPFSWVRAIVCTVVEVVKWVLKLVCKWIAYVVIVLVITCIVVSIIIIAVA